MDVVRVAKGGIELELGYDDDAVTTSGAKRRTSLVSSFHRELGLNLNCCQMITRREGGGR